MGIKDNERKKKKSLGKLPIAAIKQSLCFLLKINSTHILKSRWFYYLVHAIKISVMVICHVQSCLEFGCSFTLLGR